MQQIKKAQAPSPPPPLFFVKQIGDAVACDNLMLVSENSHWASELKS